MSIEVYLSQFRAPRVRLLCSLFQAAAHDTWLRIRFSRRVPGLKIHETTITQNLVYELNLLQQRLGIRNFRIQESLNEKSNGYDLQVVIRQRDGWYTYNIQSKILYHPSRRSGVDNLVDGTYPRLRHRVGGQAQVDVLINHSSSLGGIPLYMLYNFVSMPITERRICGILAQSSQYGCCLISAQRLKDRCSDSHGYLKRKIRFSTLYNAAEIIPWMALTCCLPRYNERQTRALFRLHPEYVIRKRIDDPTVRGGEWVPLNDPEKIVDNFQSYSEEVRGFAPRYRLIINAPVA